MMKKWGLLLLIVILALTVYTVLRWQWLHTTQTQTHTRKKNVPDAFMTGARFKQFDAAGNLERELFSPKLLRFEKTKTTHAEQPHFILYSPKQATTHLRATHGVLDEHDIVYLSGQVKIQQYELNGSPSLTAATKQLQLNLKKQVAETTNLVVIEKPGEATLQGKGLNLNWQTQTLELFSPVRGIYATL